MAGFSFGGVDDLMLSLEEVAQIPEDVQIEMLQAQAEVLADAQRQYGKLYRVQDTGVMLSKIKPGRPKLRKGVPVIYVTPSGSRLRGKKNPKRVRNAEIAFINEYGKKGQKARPFIRAANEASAEATTRAGLEVYDRWLKSKNL